MSWGDSSYPKSPPTQCLPAQESEQRILTSKEPTWMLWPVMGRGTERIRHGPLPTCRLAATPDLTPVLTTNHSSRRSDNLSPQRACLRYILCSHTLLPLTCLRKGGQPSGEYVLSLELDNRSDWKLPGGRLSPLTSFLGAQYFPWALLFPAKDSKIWASNPMVNDKGKTWNRHWTLKMAVSHGFLPSFPPRASQPETIDFFLSPSGYQRRLS